MTKIQITNEQAEVLQHFMKGRAPALAAVAQRLGHAKGDQTSGLRFAGDLIAALNEGPADTDTELQTDDKEPEPPATPVPPQAGSSEEQERLISYVDVGKHYAGEEELPGDPSVIYFERRQDEHRWAPQTWHWNYDLVAFRVICINGHIGTLMEHEINDNGVVTPSVKCSVSECGWQAFVQLLAWPELQGELAIPKARQGPATAGKPKKAPKKAKAASGGGGGSDTPIEAQGGGSILDDLTPK